jgi:hypothetical protein
MGDYEVDSNFEYEDNAKKSLLNDEGLQLINLWLTKCPNGPRDRHGFVEYLFSPTGSKDLNMLLKIKTESNETIETAEITETNDDLEFVKEIDYIEDFKFKDDTFNEKMENFKDDTSDKEMDKIKNFKFKDDTSDEEMDNIKDNIIENFKDHNKDIDPHELSENMGFVKENTQKVKIQKFKKEKENKKDKGKQNKKQMF